MHNKTKKNKSIKYNLVLSFYSVLEKSYIN